MLSASAPLRNWIDLPTVSVSQPNDARDNPTRPVLIAPEQGANYLAGLSVLDGYDDDPDSYEVHAAIHTFLSMDDSALRAAAPAIFEYYSYMTEAVIADDDMDWYVEVTDPDDVWNHIEVGPYAIVRRDGRVYVSVS